jgi:hypothetical protein
VHGRVQQAERKLDGKEAIYLVCGTAKAQTMTLHKEDAPRTNGCHLRSIGHVICNKSGISPCVCMYGMLHSCTHIADIDDDSIVLTGTSLTWWHRHGS